MSRKLNWFQARTLAFQGSKIRREAWKEWIYYATSLWFHNQEAETDHVVVAAEFKRGEFLANDWTDEPWVTDPSGEVIVPPPAPTDGIIIPTTTTPPAGGSTTPPPDTFPDPVTGEPVVAGGGSGGGSWGGGGGGAGAGGGGGGGGAGGGSSHPPHGTGGAGEAQIVITAIVDYGTPENNERHCLLSAPATVDVIARVTIMGGPKGVGDISVKLNLGELDEETQLGTAYPGFNGGFKFEGVAWNDLGSCTLDADYNQPGAPGVVDATQLVVNFLRTCEALDDNSISVASV